MLLRCGIVANLCRRDDRRRPALDALGGRQGSRQGVRPAGRTAPDPDQGGEGRPVALGMGRSQQCHQHRHPVASFLRARAGSSSGDHGEVEAPARRRQRWLRREPGPSSADAERPALLRATGRSPHRRPRVGHRHIRRVRGRHGVLRLPHGQPRPSLCRRRGLPRPQLRQEKPGAAGHGAGEVRRLVRGQRLRAVARHRPVRPHRALRRLRLQQEPRLRLRHGRLPDGLAEGQPPGRVPGRPADVGQGRQGPHRRLPVRVPGHGHRGPGARRQRVDRRVRRGRRRPRRRHREGPIPFGMAAIRNVGEGLVGLSSPSGRTAGRSPTSTTSASGSTPACSTSGRSSR